MDKEKFIKELKENMPKGLNKLEIAKYIYIKLGKEKAFDDRYFFGNRKTREQIYKLAEENEKRTERIAKEKRIICVSLTYLYRDLLKEFDIKSIVAEEGDHKYPIIYLEDGKMFKADLQLDLWRIQTQSRTNHFGTRTQYESYNVQPLNEKYAVEIDKKIGYIKDEKDYKNNAVDNIKEKVKDKNAKEILEIVLQDEEINKLDSKLGPVERSKYYNALLRETANKYICKKIFPFNCYRENISGEKDYTMCIYSLEKNDTSVYLFSNKEDKFVKVELTQLEELINQGLVLGVSGKELGVKQLHKVIKKSKDCAKKCLKNIDKAR